MFFCFIGRKVAILVYIYLALSFAAHCNTSPAPSKLCSKSCEPIFWVSGNLSFFPPVSFALSLKSLFFKRVLIHRFLSSWISMFPIRLKNIVWLSTLTSSYLMCFLMSRLMPLVRSLVMPLHFELVLWNCRWFPMVSLSHCLVCPIFSCCSETVGIWQCHKFTLWKVNLQLQFLNHNLSFVDFFYYCWWLLFYFSSCHLFYRSWVPIQWWVAQII